MRVGEGMGGEGWGDWGKARGEGWGGGGTGGRQGVRVWGGGGDWGKARGEGCGGGGGLGEGKG